MRDFIVVLTLLTALPAHAERVSLEGNYIAPAFIDLQLYGAYKKLLSAYPNAESVKAIYDYSKACNPLPLLHFVGSACILPARLRHDGIVGTRTGELR